MKRKKKRIALIAAVIVFLLALGLTVYPLIAESYSAKHQSNVESEYIAELNLVEEEDLSAYRTAAEEYNAMIAAQAEPFTDDALEEAAVGYEDLLNATGTGIMGYVIIPKIDVDLPIFHYTSDETLARGVGHMLGSSLPVGGESTHTVISGHSGMASAKMFSDIEQLGIGDVFYLKVLDETLQYEVDEISVVEPHDVSKITVTEGEDYCTLLTCTPFSVNTHRLLVRGRRVEYVPEVVDETATGETEAAEPVTVQESVWDAQYKRGLLLGLLIALLLAVIIILVDYLYRHCAFKKFRKKDGHYEQG